MADRTLQNSLNLSLKNEEQREELEQFLRAELHRFKNMPGKGAVKQVQKVLASVVQGVLDAIVTK